MSTTGPYLPPNPKPGQPDQPPPSDPIPASVMRTSEAGISLIKQSEGLKLVAYQDAGGIWTIGYGHTGPEVHDDLIWTTDQAQDALDIDVKKAEEAVSSLVRVPLTQGQFDALVDFTFNLGTNSLRTSTMLRKLNDLDYDGAIEELPKWDHADGKVLPSLVRRRLAEVALWKTGDFRLAS